MASLGGIISSVGSSINGGGLSSLYQGVAGAFLNTGSQFGQQSGSVDAQSAQAQLYPSTPPPMFAITIIANDRVATQFSPSAGPVRVSAYMDNIVGMSVTASYGAPFEQGLIGSFIGEKADLIARMFGFKTVVKQMTSQVWEGTTHIEPQVTLNFIAEHDAYSEIQQPIAQIFSLALPSTDKSSGGVGWLIPPGPQLKLATQGATGLANVVSSALSSPFQALGIQTTPDGSVPSLSSITSSANQLLSEGDASGGIISIQIGNFLFFDSVVITSVSPAYDIVLDPNGIPMRAKIDMSFRTFQIPTTDDVDSLFCLGQQAQGAGQGALDVFGLPNGSNNTFGSYNNTPTSDFAAQLQNPNDFYSGTSGVPPGFNIATAGTGV